MANREMKYSGVEWIGEIPKRWEVMKFKYVMKKDKKIAKKYNNENVISLTKSGVIIRDLENPFGKMPASFDGYQHVEEGDLLLCLFDIDVTPRCVGIVKNNGVTSPAYSRYKLMDGFDINYYNYLLTYLDDEKILLSYTKSLRNTLTDEYFGAVSTIKPSLLEQQKIAAFLDGKVAHVDSIIEDTKKSIENLKAYKQSLITETVTKGLDPNVEMKDSGIEWIGEFPFHWEKTRIKNMASIGSGSTPKSSNEDYYNGNINWIQSGDLYQKKYIEDTSRKITNKAIKEVSALKFYDAPFITIALYGASIGNVSISKIDSTVNQAVAVIEPNNISIDYLFYLLTASKSGFLSLSVGGTQPNISQTIISNWIVPYPPMDEQNRIVEFLDVKTTQIDNLIDKKEQIITEIEAYKKTLIYEYVTGKKEVE
ncbi:restriction endonuclease subunit S [Enterococcus faecium]|uniref:restriction endonuclease subunit S n=1 Tax=Enterococcus faecium TaxID=1352 RepID=UPI0028927F12|nr:restriction endonuclease subunit S [Enterococcus faecium]MDT2333862.1 restriction endonuclease subunit S [Enterococcus faecium]HBK5421527.1 restriction endonuclease subunit S [Enterococcus faecium]